MNVLKHALLAIFIRVFLFYLGLDAFLSSRIEFITPFTEFKRIIEALHLVANGLSPYAGGVFNQPPLVLLPFWNLSQDVTIHIWRITVILLDVAIGFGLHEIARLWQTQSNFKPLALSPTQMAMAYFYNPYVIGSCISLSTTILNTFSIVFCILFALKGRPMASSLFLSLSVYLTIHSIVLIVPLILLIRQSTKAPLSRSIARTTLPFTFFLSSLLMLSYHMWSTTFYTPTTTTAAAGGWNFHFPTAFSFYARQLLFEDLTPNYGIGWYIFSLMFENFRLFFVFVFQSHTLAYVGPLTVRFKEHPLFLTFIFVAVTSIFKPYPTWADFCLYLHFSFLFLDVWKKLRFGFVLACVYLFMSVVAPTFFDLWIHTRSGNANFFYFMTLVLNFAQVLFVIECMRAKLFLMWQEKRKKEESSVLLNSKTE